MSHNSFGNLLKFTTWGESHGEAIGCVVDGFPSGITIDTKFIQTKLNLRKPGQSKFTTQRKENDEIKILSGVFEGKSTGAPISMIIHNTDQRSKDYSDIKNKFRPGHADYTYFMKYKNYDYRGGGRSSARETAMRVAAGALAELLLKKFCSKKLRVTSAVIQIGNEKINDKSWNNSFINKNPFFSPNKTIIKKWEELILFHRKNGSSLGAIIEVRVSNCPVGIGEPIYQKLDSEISKAIMSINAVKGIEFGSGFNLVNLDGTNASDQMDLNKKNISFDSNHAGGVLGGISSGQDVVFRYVVKPTSSVLTEKKTITKNLRKTKIKTIGRHDPCVGIRAVPVGIAMTNFVLADLYLINKSKSL
ncbi:chorismate synthase [Alphaproteobacteria bacterium]|nr:chorismate synthase [Alphaproteobacteria bacterium]